MSYYNKENGILFVHIAKNAGRAVSRSLKLLGKGKYKGFTGSGHSTYYEFLETKSHDDDVNFKFAILRDPIERFRSAFTSCFNDDDYSSVTECIEMIEHWDSKPEWKRGSWNFDTMANVSPVNGKIFPYIPRAQFVPQTFYFPENDDIRLYDINKLDSLKKDLWQDLGLRINILHYREPYVRPKPTLSKDEKAKIREIYHKDLEIYEKINML